MREGGRSDGGRVSGETDDELVARARSGDRRAFAALIERRHRAIHRFAWRCCGDATEADDIVQETLIRIARGLDGFEGRSAFLSWAFGIALNCARDHVRARNRRTEALAEYAAAPAVDHGSGEDEDAELWDAVRELPEAQAGAVLLVHVEGLSHREAAAALGCAEATVSWRLFSARRRLRSLLSRADA